MTSQLIALVKTNVIFTPAEVSKEQRSKNFYLTFSKTK